MSEGEENGGEEVGFLRDEFLLRMGSNDIVDFRRQGEEKKSHGRAQQHQGQLSVFFHFAFEFLGQLSLFGAERGVRSANTNDDDRIADTHQNEWNDIRLDHIDVRIVGGKETSIGRRIRSMMTNRYGRIRSRWNTNHLEAIEEMSIQQRVNDDQHQRDPMGNTTITILTTSKRKQNTHRPIDRTEREGVEQGGRGGGGDEGRAALTRQRECNWPSQR